MKKRSCKLTATEKKEHEFAVKIRKMTDKQLYEFFSIMSENKSVDKFIEKLEAQTYSGIGPATIKKIRKAAYEEGFTKEI